MPKAAPKPLGPYADTLYIINHYEGITGHFFSGSSLVKTTKFFYPYSSYYDSYIDEESYINKYIELLLKAEKLAKSKVQIHHINAKDINFLGKRLKDTHHLVCYMGFYTCGIKESVASFMPSHPSSNDFLIHYACLPNLQPLAVTDALVRDKFFFSLDMFFSENSKIIFTGGRLLYSEDVAYRIYFLSSLIRQSGYFEVYIDEGDLFCLSDVFNESAARHLFSMFSDKSGLECLLTYENGTKQLVVVPAGDMFILPVESYTKMQVSIKGKQLGLREITVPSNVNDFYILIDCRNKSDVPTTGNLGKVEGFINSLKKLKGSF